MCRNSKFIERNHQFLPNWKIYACVLIILPFRIFAEVVRSSNQMACPIQLDNATTGKDDEFKEGYELSESPGRNVISTTHPMCFDSNGNIVLNICTPSGWIATNNQSQCEYYELSPTCPYPFAYKKGKCILVTNPQKADDPCPIPGAKYVQGADYNNFMWLPFRRSNKFLPYTITTLDGNYGEKAKIMCSSKCCSESKKLVHDCLVANATCVQDVPCDSKYPRMCGYNYDHFLHKCPIGCLPGRLDKGYCLCKISTENKNATRNSFCQNLAEPTSSSELTAAKILAFRDSCWISMKNAENVLPNKFPAVNAAEIKLHDDGSLSCAVCKTDPVPYSTPQMMLTFDQISRDLYLRIFYPRSLFKDNEDDLAYCFVNISRSYHDRVDVEEVWDSEDEDERQLSRPFKIFKVKIKTNTKAYYWCESFKLPNLERITSNVVRAYKRTRGCHLVSKMTVYDYCFNVGECQNMQIHDFSEIMEDIFDMYVNISEPTWEDLQVIEIYDVNTDEQRVTLLIHFSVEQCDTLNEVKDVLESVIKAEEKKFLLEYLRSVDYCLPEMANGLSWPLTPVGYTTIPEEVCVQENLVPVTRKCRGNAYSGAYWLPIVGKCSNKTLPETSLTLLNVSKSILNDTSAVLQNVHQLVNKTKEINILDTFTVGNILYQTSSIAQAIFEDDITEAVGIIDKLHDSDYNLLRQSQEILNSTDTILDATEKFLEGVNISSVENSLLLHKQRNVLVLLTNPLVNNVSGLIAYGNDFDSFLDIEVDFLYVNSTTDDLTQYEDLEVASFISNETIEQLITQNNLTSDDFKIAITIYYSDSFFQTGRNDVDSKIISVSIPGYNDLLPFSVPVFFKKTFADYNSTRQCAFWNYGIDAPNSKGQWSSVGVEISYLIQNFIDSCIYSHLTHFALLVTNVPIYIEDGNGSYSIIQFEHQKGLEIITSLGCILSMCGIVGIYLTALVFSSWRNKTGNKILLQLSHATLLTIIGLYLLNTASLQNTVWCTALGILLHYTVLAKFSWMLVSALMQLYRFVKVIGPMPSHIFLKSVIIGWIFPIIPVFIVVAIKFDEYGLEMCYPRNESLYYGVLLPILLILAVNFYVFVAVMNNLRKSHSKFPHASKDLLRRELYLAILLSFLLGIPWFFGLLIELSFFSGFLQNTFEYLFSIFVSIEGFVLFFFYVLLDGATRKMWCRYFRNNFYKASSNSKIHKSPIHSTQHTKDSKVITNSTH